MFILFLLSILKFQSTPPARGATRHVRMLRQLFAISIHAPREGGDGTATLTVDGLLAISIHAPREGGDAHRQSLYRAPYHFNPRPPRGGRRYISDARAHDYKISIHAPREGGDCAAVSGATQY